MGPSPMSPIDETSAQRLAAAVAPHLKAPNGRNWTLLQWVAGAVVAGLVAYFTAMGSVQTSVAVVDSREQQHFEEVQRTLQRIERAVERLEQREPR